MPRTLDGFALAPLGPFGPAASCRWDVSAPARDPRQAAVVWNGTGPVLARLEGREAITGAEGLVASLDERRREAAEEE